MDDRHHMESSGTESRGKTLRGCGSNVTLTNYADSRGIGHVRVEYEKGRWYVFILTLSFVGRR